MPAAFEGKAPTTMPNAVHTDLAVIGSGMAGLCAALFALRKGLSTVVCGTAGPWAYTSGPLDLLGVYPVQSRALHSDPWIGIQALVKDLPKHPYAQVSEASIRTAFAVLLEALRDAEYPHGRLPDGNCDIITSLGTIKRTYCLPHTMWDGVEAFRNRVPCLIVDFEGMKDFSARQIVATLSDRWPALRCLRIPFPGAEGLPEVSTEYLARCLDSADCRARLASLVGPHIRDAEALALPPVLGFRHSTQAVADLRKRLGTLIFEIPSLPVSVPGIRLERAFGRFLGGLGVQRFPKLVVRVDQGAGGDFEVHAGCAEARVVLRAKAVVLASGRFLGGGLAAGRDLVRETVFDLPVHQPARRSLWHQPQLLDPRGHAINQAGLEVDASFRPLGTDGAPVYPNLFAVGSVLAHQDWMRMKCGSGLSIATAHRAVEACLDFVRSRGAS